MSQPRFDSLPVSQELKRAADELGFEYATEIQFKTIPLILEGRDLIGKSQTGTGKTAAFAIPAVQLTDGENKKDIQVLVVSPTRELALQSWDVFKKLYKYKSGVKAAALYGGQPIERQIKELKRGVNIVIGTPGRIMDHMRRKTLKLDNLKMIVLDEADEMLNMGFRENIETILRKTPENRQTIFFCATMPPEIMEITKNYSKQPEFVEINKNQATIEAIKQYYCEVPAPKKPEALMQLLRSEGLQKSIVFCNTQKMVDEVCRELNLHEINAFEIHGRIRQDIRTRIMNDFKSGKISVLVATDVASRGIDASDVMNVVNYDIPQDAEDYIHRIGRTGRAGKSGKAFTLVCDGFQLMQLREYKRSGKLQIELYTIPGAEPFPKINEIKGCPARRIKTERKSAAAFSKNDTKSKKAVLKGGMERVIISLGKKQHLTPNHVVAAIAENTALSGSDIGKIVMLQNSTIVEIPASHIKEVIDALGGSTIRGIPAHVTLCGPKAQKNEYKNKKHLTEPAAGERRTLLPRGVRKADRKR